MMRFGWIPPEERTKEQEKTHELLVSSMPSFELKGSWKAKEKVFFWDASKAVTGKHLKTFNQNVGSCTGQGKAMVEWYLMCLEVLRGDPEQVIMPYEPYGYAQGRVCAGISGDQDGGLGSGTAEAARKYGVLRSDLQGLPKWNESEDTIDWPGEVDKSWGRRGAEQKWVTEGVKHLVKTTALISSADRAAEALQNGYPITIASNWGGHMDDVPLAGTPQVRLNKRVTTWMHQMCVIGWWDHPTLKEIYYVQNSWSARRHGTPVNGEPPGGFWIDKNNMNYILRQGDSYAFSTFDGFPADTIPWLFL